jgi:hypothetical protein
MRNSTRSKATIVDWAPIDEAHKSALWLYADALVAPPRWSRRDLVERELESVVLARLGSAPLADAVPAVDGRDVEPGHRGVAVSYFTEA